MAGGEKVLSPRINIFHTNISKYTFLNVQVPVTGGSWMADYDLKLGAVDVDLGGLGPLGDLASLIAPQVAEVVKKKICEVMEGDVKNIIIREMEKRIPNITSLVT